MDSTLSGNFDSRPENAAEVVQGLETVLQLATQGVNIKSLGWPNLVYLPIAPPEVPQEVAYIIHNANTGGRALWLLGNGSTALVPDTVRVGDVPVVLFGGKFIYFL